MRSTVTEQKRRQEEEKLRLEVKDRKKMKATKLRQKSGIKS